LKLENVQLSGSFKIRGALNKLLSLEPAQRAKGVVTASTGNHGLAVAYGLRKLDIPGTIYLPEGASQQKVCRLRDYGVELQFQGGDCLETELIARARARETGAVYVSPYNDPQIVGGQGTISVELLRQMDHVDVVFASVGGGGLIGGISGHLKEMYQKTRVVGCLPQNSPVMAESVRAGRVVPCHVLPTLSDGTAGGLEEDAITLELCQRYVDDWTIVTEDEIAAAMRFMFERHQLVVEGAAGVAVAGFLRLKDVLKRDRPTNVVIVICGGNIEIEQFKQVVC
jgi:threonine dehydratase